MKGTSASVVLLWSVAGAVSGCGGGGADRAAVSVRDSAGIAVVVTYAPVAPDRLPDIGPPEVSIGDAGTELNSVVGALRLSDGRIVIADGGDEVIRYFSADGLPTGTVGGEGDGPSEFRILQAIGRLTGDTVWAYDFSHHRVTIISPEMQVARSVTLDPPLGSGLAVGVLPNGEILLGESWSSTRVVAPTEPGLNREPVAYVTYSLGGELLDTVGLFPGREVLLTYEDGRGVMGPVPMARHAVHALGDEWFAIGDQVEHEIRFFSFDGRQERIVRWEGGDLSVTSELESAWREARLASVSSAERARAERQLAEQVLPAHRPAFGGILPTAEGGLWVGAYSLEGDEAGSWAVFDGEGVWQGLLATPDRFRPLEVGSTWVLGVSRDEFDVAHVELRTLAPRR